MAFSLLQLMLTAVAVEGESSCPTPSAVAAHLADVASKNRNDRLRIDQVANGIALELSNESEGVLARGHLPAEDDCEALARAVAVMVQAWQASLATPSEVLSLAPPPLEEPRLPSPRQRRLDYDIRVGPAVFWANTQVGLGGHTSITVGVDEFPLRAELSIAAQKERAQPIGNGFAHWRRISISAGPAVDAIRKPISLRASAFGSVGHLAVRGSGFANDRSSGAFEGGLGGAVVADATSKSLRPFVSIGVLWWPGPQRVRVEGVDEASAIPALEVCLSAGVAWRPR